MSLRGTRCPFVFKLPPEDKSKVQEINFKKPIDAADPDGIKLTYSAKVLQDTDTESILKHELQFTRLQDSMGLNNIEKRRAVYEATLGDNLRSAWIQAVTEPPLSFAYNALNLLEFRDAREQFVLNNTTRSLAMDTRHWLLYDLKKPRDMSVHDFVTRVNEI